MYQLYSSCYSAQLLCVLLTHQKKMSQILFALFALAFVQLAKSQTTECTDATSALSDQCIYLLNTFDPAACSGTCGTQWAAVYSDCQSSVSLLLHLATQLNSQLASTAIATLWQVRTAPIYLSKSNRLAIQLVDFQFNHAQN